MLNKDKGPLRWEQGFFMRIALQNLSHKKSKNFAEKYAGMIHLDEDDLI